MVTFSKPTPLIVFINGQEQLADCDGYDIKRTWYDGRKNRCVLQPMRYVNRDRPGDCYFCLEPFGEDYAISFSHPNCPAY